MKGFTSKLLVLPIVIVLLHGLNVIAFGNEKISKKEMERNGGTNADIMDPNGGTNNDIGRDVVDRNMARDDMELGIGSKQGYVIQEAVGRDGSILAEEDVAFTPATLKCSAFSSRFSSAITMAYHLKLPQDGSASNIIMKNSGTSPEVILKSVDFMEDLFVEVYNKLIQDSCDPFYRRLAMAIADLNSIAISWVPSSGGSNIDEKTNVKAVVLIEASYALEGFCEGCHKEDNNAVGVLFTPSSNQVTRTMSLNPVLGHYHLRASVAIEHKECPCHNVNPSSQAPVDSELLAAMNQVLQDKSVVFVEKLVEIVDQEQVAQEVPYLSEGDEVPLSILSGFQSDVDARRKLQEEVTPLPLPPLVLQCVDNSTIFKTELVMEYTLAIEAGVGSSINDISSNVADIALIEGLVMEVYNKQAEEQFCDPFFRRVSVAKFDPSSQSITFLEQDPLDVQVISRQEQLQPSISFVAVEMKLSIEGYCSGCHYQDSDAASGGTLLTPGGDVLESISMGDSNLCSCSHATNSSVWRSPNSSELQASLNKVLDSHDTTGIQSITSIVEMSPTAIVEVACSSNVQGWSTMLLSDLQLYGM